MNENMQQQLMILQPQHKHEQSHPQPLIINPVPIESPKPQKKEESQKPPPILSHLLSNSIQLLNQKSTNQIKGMMKYSEEKILLTFSEDPNNYLTHLMSKSQGEGNQQILKQIISLENDLFIDKIELGEQELHEKGNLNNLKASLSNKITDIKRSIMSLSSIERKVSKQVEQNIMEFRRKSYWNIPSQKNQQLKSFLSKMKRIYSEQKRNYKKSYKQMQMRSKKEIEQQLKQKQAMKKEMYSKQLQKQTLWRKERLKYNEQQKKKRQQIQNLLKKFNPDQRIYQRKQEQFIKNVIEPMEEQRHKKLEERKQKYQPLDHDQLEEHLQKYQEYKESLLDEYSKKKEQEKDMNTKLQQQLKQLFHGKFHQAVSSPRFYNSMKVQKDSIRKKLKEYTTEVRRHKPNIDMQKRAQMKELIRDLQLSKNKKKRKVVLQDGTVVIRNKPQIDPRKLGVQYLQKLKEENEGKPRKKEQNSASLIEIQNKTKFKKIDYLRQNKPNIKLKQSMGDWKKVIQDDNYSPRQKYVSIMQKVNMMQQKAKQKQSQMRSYKKGEKSLQLKQEMDRFYMQSVAAKMVILKDVILKE